MQAPSFSCCVTLFDGEYTLNGLLLYSYPYRLIICCTHTVTPLHHAGQSLGWSVLQSLGTPASQSEVVLLQDLTKLARDLVGDRIP